MESYISIIQLSTTIVCFCLWLHIQRMCYKIDDREIPQMMRNCRMQEAFYHVSIIIQMQQKRIDSLESRFESLPACDPILRQEIINFEKLIGRLPI